MRGGWPPSLVKLLADPGLRLTLGAFGRRLVVERFSLDRAAAVQEEVYLAALDSARRSRPGNRRRCGQMRCSHAANIRSGASGSVCAARSLPTTSTVWPSSAGRQPGPQAKGRQISGRQVKPLPFDPANSIRLVVEEIAVEEMPTDCRGADGSSLPRFDLRRYFALTSCNYG